MVSRYLPSETTRHKQYKPNQVWPRWSFLSGLLLALISWAPALAQTPTPIPAPVIPAPVIPDGPAAETVLETLWRNSLYAIANDACRAQVDLLPVGSDARIRWQCWLIRGLASEAIDVEDRSPPDVEKAKQNWAQIESIHSEAQATTPPLFRNLWIRWQFLHAIHLRSQGAMARYLANPLDNASRDLALASIRELDRGAELLQKSIAELVVTNSASTTAQARKQIRELQELATETALLRCEALALRGQAYPLQSADAIAAGTEMEQFAIEAASKIATDWSGRSKLDLALAVSKWLQGNRSETLERAQTLLQSNDSRVRLRALDLLVQAALQGGDRELVERTMLQFQSLEATPEYALAQMRLALFDLPKDANASSVRRQAMSQLLASRDAIGQRFGGYWQRRAEALLLSVTSSGSSNTMSNSNEATELVRIEVRQLIAASRLDEAVNKLLQQAALLKRDQVNDVAIQLTLQAAAIQQKEKNWNGSGDLFRQAAVDFPSQKDASAAHLMAIYCITQAVRSSPKDTALWSKLDDLFVEQLKLFPEDPASLQAAQQYGQSANARRIWQEAANKLRPHIANVFFSHDLAWLIVELEMRGISWQYLENDPRTLENTQKTLVAWRDWAAALDKETTNENLRNLGAAAQVVLLDMLPEALTLPLEADPSLESFRGQWKKTQLLPEESGFAWKEAWQVVMNAKQEMATKRVLTNKSIGSLTNVLGVANTGIGAAPDSNKAGQGNQAATVLSPSVALWCATDVILEQLEMLNPTERSDSRESMMDLFRWLTIASEQPSWNVVSEDRLNLMRWRLGVFGKDRQSYLVQLDGKIKIEPRVPVWQRTKALLLETGGADDLDQALGIYRKLAAGAKTGSYDWLRARYRSALCLLWLKKTEDARQAAEVILLTHPPTEPIWKSRLEALKNLK
jgi:hypothetical protein